MRTLSHRSNASAARPIARDARPLRALQRLIGFLLAIGLVVSSAGCASSSVPAQPSPPLTVAIPSPNRSPVGSWHWSYVSTKNSVRRVEHEHWQLTAEQAQLEGTLVRTVTFISLSGVPFACSHTHRYQLVARYRLSGRYEPDGAMWLREEDVSLQPSPCELDARTLLQYRGSIDERGRLVLHWPAGSQTLTKRPPTVADTSTSSSSASNGSSPTVAGSWQWRRQGPADSHGQLRQEVEHWQLSESADGVITGTLVRTVTVDDAAGQRMGCSGATWYRYRDRYTIRGRRQGHTVMLSETSVDAAAHPCLAYSRRHLDSAQGRLYDGYIELYWRGQRRQVLHRPVPDTNP